MTVEKTIQYVDDLLEINGLCKNGEGHLLRQVLHYLYSALALYEQLDEKDRKLLKLLQKKIEIFFVSKIKLKERRRKTEKKIFPSHSLYKEKEEKEKEEKQIYKKELDSSAVRGSLKHREEIFHQECLARKDVYGLETVERFYDHWREKSTRKRKMRFELETTWDIDIRMEQWVNNPLTVSGKTAKIRLKKMERELAKEATSAQKQAAVAEIREDNNARLEREIAERKKGAVSYEEYLKMKDEK